jgi:hypothetical protein
MIERRRKSVRIAAIALIHAHYVHAGSQALRRNAQHVLRVTRSLQPVDQNDRERMVPLRLPMAMAQNPYPGLNFDEALLWRSQLKTPVKEKAGQRLNVSATHVPPCNEISGLRIPHELILMER